MLNKLSYKNRVLAVYIVTFIVALVSSVYLAFPNEMLRSWVTREIVKATPFQEVEIEKIKLKPFLTIELEGVTLKQKENNDVIIDKAVLRPSVFSLTGDNISVPFRIGMYSGEITGALSFSRGMNRVNSLSLNIEHIDFNEISGIYAANMPERVAINGYLFGSIQTDENSEGVFRFDIDDLDISDISLGKMKLPDILDLKTTLKGKVMLNNTLIDELSFINDDISLRLNGSMPPVWRLPSGSIDLYYKLQVKSNKFSYIKSFLAKDEEGNHAGKIGGTLDNPKFVNGRRNSESRSGTVDRNIDKTSVFNPMEKLSL